MLPSSLSKTSTICGTASHLAPEMVFGEGYNKMADWWMLGVTLYELSTGQVNFQGSRLKKTILRMEIPRSKKFPTSCQEASNNAGGTSSSTTTVVPYYYWLFKHDFIIRLFYFMKLNRSKNNRSIVIKEFLLNMTKIVGFHIFFDKMLQVFSGFFLYIGSEKCEHFLKS